MEVVHDPSLDQELLSVLYGSCTRQERVQHRIRVKIESLNNIVFPHNEFNKTAAKENEKLQLLSPTVPEIQNSDTKLALNLAIMMLFLSTLF